MMEIESVMDEVCVFREGARVTRRASLPCQSGQFIIKNLPLCLDDESLSLNLVKPKEGVSINQLLCHVDLLHRDESKEQLDKELDRLENERKLIQGSLRSFTRDLSEIASLHYVARSKVMKISLEQLSKGRLELAKFKTEQLRSLQQERFALEEQKADLDKKIHQLKETTKNQSGHDFSKCISFSLEAESEQADLEIQISYTVPGATWSAAYTLDLHSSAQNILRMRAIINQNTGEDWDQVKLKLSTSALRSWKKLPELKSLHIGRKQEQEARSTWRPAPDNTDLLFIDYDRTFHPSKLKNLEKAKAPKAQSYAIPIRGSKPANLIVLSECARGQTIELDKSPITVGRDVECDLFIDDGTVSSMHAEVYFEDDRYYVKDNSSCNGTRINGVRVTSQFLENSDILQVGGIELLFDTEEHGNTTAITTQTCISLDDLGGGFNPDELKNISGGCVDEDILDVPSSASSLSLCDGAQNFKAFGQLDGPIMRSVKPKKTSSSRRSKTKRVRKQLANELFNFSRIGMQLQGDQRGQLTHLSVLNYYSAYLETISESELEGSLAQSFESASQKVDLPYRHYPPYQNDGFDYLFESDGFVDIKSGGEWNSVPVFNCECQADLSYVACPRESEQVFRMAKIKAPKALLAGAIDINMDGIYLLTSELDWSLAKQAVELCLGVETQVKLIRDCDYIEKSSGMISQSTALLHSISNKVQNGLNQELEIELRERLPLPAKDEKVKVEQHGVSPAWQVLKAKPHEQDEEVYFWKAKIAPGESQKFEFSYSILLASKEEIRGGNRRDF